jgi:hypothetical protein
MNRLAVCCLLVAAAAASKPALSRPPLPLVTFSAPAMQADRLMKSLSARTGVPLECAPETRAEVLLLHVNARPLPEVLARLEEAAGAKWVPAGGGYRLVRPPEMERAQREHDLAVRARFLARGLGEITAPLTKPWDDQALVAARREQLRRTGRPVPRSTFGATRPSACWPAA